MKIFLDTANVKEIREAHELGLLDGVTTNPSLVSKEGHDFHEVLRELCSFVNGPVNAEVLSVDGNGMVSEGRTLSKIHKNIVVKIPLIKEGLKAVKILRGEGIRVNVTLCFSPTQALLAAKAGASYISPFIGRLDDVSEVGMDIVRDIKTIYSNYGFKTEILVASIRHPLHVLEAAKIGADIATMPFEVFNKLFNHPLTDIGLARFLSDWEKLKKK
ncbi:MAG: fructose-6-phosphate aldolase [Candidatus Omnitrophica bacterium]|nr:fructose-6-phosphate aldolase [Candidatus Omnitrophota bacterium]